MFSTIVFGTLASQFGVIHNVVMRGVHFFI